MLCTIGIVAAGEISVPLYGTLLSRYCTQTSSLDAISQYWAGAWESWATYADGLGGSFNASTGSNNYGCFIPYGFYYTYDPYQRTISWSHGDDYGNFVYGEGYNASISDGNGGLVSISNSIVTATDGQIVHQFTSNDPTSGYPTVHTLYFRLSDISLQSTDYIVAGTFISSGCTTLYNYLDVVGNSFTVGAFQSVYADGFGGYYTSNLVDTMQCGFLPYGFYTYYQSGPMGFDYQKSDLSWSNFAYGESVSFTFKDGYGGATVSASQSINFPAGYIFYSYHDDVGQKTVNYAFDGVSGYVIQYVNDE